MLYLMYTNEWEVYPYIGSVVNSLMFNSSGAPYGEKRILLEDHELGYILLVVPYTRTSSI